MKKYMKLIDGKTVIKTRHQIVVSKNGRNFFNPTEEMILADGWVIYERQITQVGNSRNRMSRLQVAQEIIMEQYNSRTDIPDAEALERAVVIYNWDRYIGKPLNAGQVVVYEDQVYRVRQQITEVLSIYPPSLATASLYEAIVLTATGEIDDPIPYTPPMEIFNGKYYTQEDVKYKCTRDSGVALTHNLRDLVGMYVEVEE